MRNKSVFWLFALSSAVYFTQGIESLPSQALFYYLKETLNFTPEKIMLISSITTFAWLVKPPIGYVVDNFFSKRAWIFLALLLDIALVFIIGSIQIPLAILIIILIINSANAAFRDVAVDGIMCVEGKKNNSTGKIQSVQWISISAAILISGVGGGFIAEKCGYKVGFLALIPVYLLVGVIAWFYKENDGALLSAGTPLKEVSPKMAHFVSDMKQLFADKRLLIIALFIFLYKYSPSFGTPLFFIQRDAFKWSKMWIGLLASISTAFGIIGSLLYYKMSQKINMKKWLFFSVFLGAVTTLSYLYYTPRAAVIYDLVYNFVGMFIFLMIMDFMARNTVKGLEATSFAFLCSVSNLAMVASNLSGAFLLPVIGLKWLIVISALTSFLCLPLISVIANGANEVSGVKQSPC